MSSVSSCDRSDAASPVSASPSPISVLCSVRSFRSGAAWVSLASVTATCLRRIRVARQPATLSALVFMWLGGGVLTLISTLKQPPRPLAPPVKGPIDGTYRFDRYRGESTTRAPDGNVLAAAPKYSIVETEWWALQSACPPPSCMAVGTRLDNTTHTQIAAQLAPGVGQNEKIQSLRLVNGQWVSDPPNRLPQDCAAGTPGHDMRRSTMELVQLANGTLKGQESDLIESNECGHAGTLVTTPIVATRVGDLPRGLPPLKTK